MSRHHRQQRRRGRRNAASLAALGAGGACRRAKMLGFRLIGIDYGDRPSEVRFAGLLDSRLVAFGDSVDQVRQIAALDDRVAYRVSRADGSKYTVMRRADDIRPLPAGATRV